MKIQIASDLHLDLLQQRFPGYRAVEFADADVLVIAGDIHHGAAAVEAFADWPVPVIYVHGNHEAYHDRYSATIDNLRAAAAGSNVHYLECDEYAIGDVRFLGCCLWTDYRLYPERQQAAMQEAENVLHDHRLIQTDRGVFTAENALQLHRTSRAWLDAKLNESFHGHTVVITHHAPHPLSIAPRFAGSLLNAAFASDLTSLLMRADLWIHGHVHDSFDYIAAGTRVIANPRGYALNRHAAASITQIDWENPRFDARLVVNLS